MQVRTELDLDAILEGVCPSCRVALNSEHLAYVSITVDGDIVERPFASCDGCMLWLSGWRTKDGLVNLIALTVSQVAVYGRFES